MNITRHKDRDRDHSQLFLVRLWVEESNDGAAREASESSEGSGPCGSKSDQVEWCGKLQDVVSGQAHYFRGWPTLIDRLLEMAVSGAPDGSDRTPPNSRTEEAL